MRSATRLLALGVAAVLLSLCVANKNPPRLSQLVGAAVECAAEGEVACEGADKAWITACNEGLGKNAKACKACKACVKKVLKRGRTRAVGEPTGTEYVGDSSSDGEADAQPDAPRSIDIIATALGGETDAWETRAQHCGALMLAHHVRNMTGWRLRVYHDDEQKIADMNILGSLQALGVELLHVKRSEEAPANCVDAKGTVHTKHFWPLRVLSDSTVRTSIILDAAAPFSVHKLVTLAERLSQDNERWAFWRNPDEAFTDVPDNAHASQMHFIGTRNPHVGVVKDLEDAFCDSNRQKEVKKHGWNHESVMDFPISTLIPIFKYQSNNLAVSDPSEPKQNHSGGITGVPGTEILGRQPGLHHTEPGSSLHFQWEADKSEKREAIVPFFKVQAWPRLDCRYARDKEECLGAETHPDLHRFSFKALDRLDKDWHEFCTADVSSDFELLKTDAKRGSIYTTLILAHKLRGAGQGDEANEWLEKMDIVDRLGKQVEKGDAQAAYNLGVLHHHGRGVEQNATIAYLLYQKARDGNVSAAVYSMGLMRESGEGVEQNHGEAARLYHSIASDHGGAANRMAGLWMNGEGVVQNFEEGVQLYKWAALRHKDADAQFAVAELHREGKHVEQDDVRAVDMYSRAAKQDHAAAMRSIGLMYWEGRGGLNVDKKMARFMFYKAENAGDKASKEIQARLKEEEDAERAEADTAAGVKPSEEPFDLSKMKFQHGGFDKAERNPVYFGDA